MFTAPFPFLLPALCLLHPVHRKPEEPVAVHSTYDNMTNAHRRVVQTIATATESSPKSVHYWPPLFHPGAVCPNVKMESRDLATNQIQIQKDNKEVIYCEV